MKLIFCGDFEHFALDIQTPAETLVSSIIERVATSLDIPSVEISLYFNDQLLQPASPLSPQGGTQLRSGAALLVVANPLIITIQRYDTDMSFNLEISRLAAPQWTTDTLFDFCLYKAGMPRRKNGKYVFTVQETMLKEGKTICDFKILNNNFTITIAFLKAVLIQDLITFGENTRSVLIPTGCTDDKVLSGEQTIRRNSYPGNNFRCSLNVNRHTLQLGELLCDERQIYGRWKFTIQAIDGTKKKVELENHCLTPVYELKNKVYNSFGKIRLTFGKTILEDFDEEGHMMLLCSYPQLHDGATLYQINLPDATSIHVHVLCNASKQNIFNRYTNVKLRVPTHFDENFTMECPRLIHIENPNEFTVQRFISAMENFGTIESVQTNDALESMSRNKLLDPSIPSDAVVSSVKCLEDGCTVKIYDQYY